MLVTFHSGREALAALLLDGKEVLGEKIRIQLQTPDWKEKIHRELKLGQSNTASLYSATTNSLLGEDFSIPTLSFDMDGECSVR